jgi:hypothetical protein
MLRSHPPGLQEPQVQSLKHLCTNKPHVVSAIRPLCTSKDKISS